MVCITVQVGSYIGINVADEIVTYIYVQEGGS
jgi:hypothetical protein